MKSRCQRADDSRDALGRAYFYSTQDQGVSAMPYTTQPTVVTGVNIPVKIGDATVMAYIGRSGWNTLRIGGAIPDDEVLEAIDTSYSAIVGKLPKKDRP